MRIVVVEDEAPIREGMSKILGKISANYELVGKAENGKKGLEIIREQRPDLVIMDIQMPDMDGLTMLSYIREEAIPCRTVVLSAYSDFSYAKQAIELGIESYLLKPIKIPELKKVLSHVEHEIRKEQSQEYLFSLEHIFLNAITGQLEKDRKLAEIIWERYGIARDEQLELLAIGLDENYGKHHAQVKRMLDEVSFNNKKFKSYVIEVPHRQALVMILWKMEDIDETYTYFQQKVVPALCSQVKDDITCCWGSGNGLLKVRKIILELEKECGWNLLLGNGSLIGKRTIEEREVYPLKYPIDIETRAKEALLDKKTEEFMQCLERFKEYCMSQRCTPEEVKEAITRYMLSMIYTAKELGQLDISAASQPMLNRLVPAIRWKEIRSVFQTFLENLTPKEEKEEFSFLITKAQKYMREYYNQGITLEEIAGKLHVSEEYLSTQFKKETGKTFTETMRKYRLEHIKQLLLQSSLKLNQIADVVGYSDPKYMSKVFKEEVGMLPLEYRKKNS